MSPTSQGIKGRVLWLVDAVDWTEAYGFDHPLRDVGSWFSCHLKNASLPMRVLTARDFVESEITYQIAGLIMSGSPKDAWADDEGTHRLMKALTTVAERKIPFLGVCYGHQILARTFGGRVEPDPAGLELGRVEVTLTEEGQKCPIFKGFQKCIPVLESHRDSVLQLPEGAHLLASNAHTPVQAFSISDRMFGVQFHPEMNPEVLRFLWEPRKAHWRSRVHFNLDERLNALEAAPESSQVLRNFADFCLQLS